MKPAQVVRESAIWYSFLLVAAGLFVCVELVQSVNVGQLAFPSAYDNNAYLGEAATAFRALSDQGFRTLLAGFPPHAPLTTTLAMAGFWMFGIRDWAPSVVNVLPVFVFVLVVADLGRDLPRGQRICLVVAALCAPPLGFLVVDMFVDALWGMLMSSAIALTLTREAITRNGMRFYIAAVLAGVAIIAKPTFLPISILLIGVCACAAALIAWRQSRSVAVGATFVALYALLASPLVVLYSYYNWSFVYGYIYDVVFSSHAAGWLLQKPGTLREEARFYLDGPGGQVMLGPWLAAFVVATVLRLAAQAAARDALALQITAAFLTTVVVSYLSIAVPQAKSVHFGTTLSFLLIVGTIVGVVDVLRRTPPWAGVAAYGIAAAALASFHFQSFRFPVWLAVDPAAAARHWTRTIDAVPEMIEEDGWTKGDITFMTGIYGFLNATTLAYTAQKEGLWGQTYVAQLRRDDIEDYLPLMGYANFVIGLDPYTDSANVLVPAAVRSQLAAMLRDEAEFEPRQKIGFEGHTLATIYARRPMFSGFGSSSGLSDRTMVSNPPGVPGAHALLRPSAPSVDLNVMIPASGEVVLTALAEAQGHPPGPMRVTLDGAEVGRLTFEPKGDDGAASLAFKGRPGLATVELEVGDAFAEVAFRQLRVADR